MSPDDPPVGMAVPLVIVFCAPMSLGDKASAPPVACVDLWEATPLEKSHAVPFQMYCLPFCRLVSPIAGFAGKENGMALIQQGMVS